MSASEQKTADFWLKLRSNPERYLGELLKAKPTPQTPEMFAYGINKLAAKDVNKAIELWDDNKDRYEISEWQFNKLEKRLAMKLVFENDANAYDRLGQLDDADYKHKSWRIRTALTEQDWSGVITAIEDLSDANRRKEKWQYWLARAYEETGKPVQAEELFSELASKRDFYGYMAADRLNQAYQLSNKPLAVTNEDIATIGMRKSFQVAYEFKMLERPTEAKLHWWFAVRQLEKYEIPAAAKLAQQWGWDEIAIFTIAKVKYWDDIDLRFPLSYSDEIHKNALENNLNPVILYGLVRRESAFNKDAASPVGARGLMQIMPATARTIAKDLKERWKGNNSLYEAEKNLKYGSYYYRKLLSQFDGNYALALAAYNAGPHRVKQWLPEESMPADIWIETIPFKETREYVTNVLVYSLIYQQIMQSSDITVKTALPDNLLSMNDLTRDVKPSVEVALNQ
jgi:soluble lytic murein transglycosylase